MHMFSLGIVSASVDAVFERVHPDTDEIGSHEICLATEYELETPFGPLGRDVGVGERAAV